MQNCPANDTFDAKKELKRVLRGQHLPEGHQDKPAGDWLSRTVARVTASVAAEAATALGYEVSYFVSVCCGGEWCARLCCFFSWRIYIYCILMHTVRKSMIAISFYEIIGFDLPHFLNHFFIFGCRVLQRWMCPL